MIGLLGADRALVRTLYSLLVGGFVIRLGGAVCTFVLGVLLARGLGPEEYGYYGLALANVSLLLVFAQLGLPTLAMRETSRAFALRDRETIGSILTCFGGIVASAAIIISVGYIAFCTLFLSNSQYLMYSLYPTALLIPVLAGATLLGSILSGLQRVLTWQLLDVLIRPLLSSLLFLVFILSAGTMKTVYALGIQLVTGTIIIICTLYVINRQVWPAVGYGSTRHVATWTRAAVPFMLTDFIRALNGNSALLISSMFLTPASLGQVRLALSIAGFVGLTSSVANTSLGPFLAKNLAEGKKQDAQHTLLTASILLTVSNTAVLLIFWSSGRAFITRVFGENFSQSVPVILVFISGELIVSVFGISATYLGMAGKQSLTTIAYVIAVPLGMATTVFLVKWLGPTGAAWGNVLMVSTWHIVIYVFFQRRLELDPSLFALRKYI